MYLILVLLSSLPRFLLSLLLLPRFALLDEVAAQKHLPLAVLSGATQTKTRNNLTYFSDYTQMLIT